MADYPTAPVVNGRNLQRELNRCLPAAEHVQLGDVLNDLISQVNALTAKYAAFLAHVDTGNVTGIGSSNAASYGVSPAQLTTLSARLRET
jgi:hypothetical protein